MFRPENGRILLSWKCILAYYRISIPQILLLHIEQLLYCYTVIFMNNRFIYSAYFTVPFRMKISIFSEFNNINYHLINRADLQVFINTQNSWKFPQIGISTILRFFPDKFEINLSRVKRQHICSYRIENELKKLFAKNMLQRTEYV